MTILASYASMRNTFSTTGVIDADGYEEWPSASLTASTWATMPKPITAFPITLTASVGADCHAYLSQRTDVVADQYLEIVAANATVDSWTIGLTAHAVSEFALGGVTSTLTADQVSVILRDVTLYTQRVSDDTIRMLQLDIASLANY